MLQQREKLAKENANWIKEIIQIKLFKENTTKTTKFATIKLTDVERKMITAKYSKTKLTAKHRDASLSVGLNVYLWLKTQFWVPFS